MYVFTHHRRRVVLFQRVEAPGRNTTYRRGDYFEAEYFYANDILEKVLLFISIKYFTREREDSRPN